MSRRILYLIFKENIHNILMTYFILHVENTLITDKTEFINYNIKIYLLPNLNRYYVHIQVDPINKTQPRKKQLHLLNKITFENDIK